MAKFEVRFNGDICKGCELCVLYCPKKIVTISSHINNKGYSPATVEDMNSCTGCRACALVCPDGAISIYKEEVAL